MKRIVSLLLVLLLCLGFMGAARPQTAAPADVTLASLKRNGTEVTSASSLNLYDVVTFGRYPQSAYGQSADIEWIVVGFDGDNRVKLLSRYCLDMRQYNDDALKVSWTSTSLYAWLNSVFKYAAFSGEEQDRLAYLSIPTVEEAQDLPLSYRRCINTPYAIGHGADSINCMWWLSDRGQRIEKVDYTGDKHYYYCASAVQGNGEIMVGGFQANFNGKSVRPLIIVDLNANRASSPVQRRGAAIRSVFDVSLYDTVTFGKYSQALYGEASEIEWIVAGIEGNKVKLIAKYGLDCRPYNDTHTMITWQSSSLYYWLNNTFLYTAFSSSDRKLLNGDVSLPNVTEARMLPRTYQICTPTEYAIANGVSKNYCIWWLSDPTRMNNGAWCASAMLENYDIFEAGYKITSSSKAVRPMIVVDLSKLN